MFLGYILTFAAALYLQFVLHIVLFHMLNVFCTFTSMLYKVFVQCPVWVFFYSSLISCFPGMLLRYCLSDFEMVPVTPLITSITFAFTFHMHWISIIRSLYIKIFSACFLITFCLLKLRHLLLLLLLCLADFLSTGFCGCRPVCYHLTASHCCQICNRWHAIFQAAVIGRWVFDVSQYQISLVRLRWPSDRYLKKTYHTLAMLLFHILQIYSFSKHACCHV